VSSKQRMSGTPGAPDPGLAPPSETAGAPASAGAPPAGRGGFRVRTITNSLFEMQSNSVLIAVLLVLALFAIAHPSFYSVRQIQVVLQSSVYVGVIACGMAFLIAMRQLDLSVSSILALTTGIAALLMNHGWNPWLAALAALGCAGLMGLFNSFLVQTVRINASVRSLRTSASTPAPRPFR
jgi:ribose transport system permease protein